MAMFTMSVSLTIVPDLLGSIYSRVKSKAEVSTVFIAFKSMVENQLNCKIKALQTDWGGEYRGLTPFFQQHGITHRVSCPYTAQQNGLADRKHRHIVEMGLALLFQSNLPMKYWDDAFTTKVFIINQLPSKVLKYNIPLEQLFKQKPDFTTFRVFGCLCYPILRPYNKHKLQPRSASGTFLGFSPKHKGYKVLLPNGKVIVSRDVLFD